MQFTLPYCPLGGEMLELERNKLFPWVYESEPTVVIEIGGGQGGGSSFHIVEALAQLKDEGKCQDSLFFSVDPINRSACDFFGTTDRYSSFTKFFPATSADLIERVRDGRIPTPDFLFFDGPEEPSLNLEDFKFFDSLVQSGCKFSCHDWETVSRMYDGATSIKAETLRPYIEGLDTWHLEERLSGLPNEWPNDTEARSVGLVYYRKI